MPTTESPIVSAVKTKFTGMHFHDPAQPAETLLVLPYGGSEGRTEDHERNKTALQFAGRVYPVYDFGDNLAESIGIKSSVGYLENHYEVINKIREMAKSDKIFCYRDGRRRKMYGAISDLSIDDVDLATNLSFKVDRADFTEEIA